MERAELLDKILRVYAPCYDIEVIEQPETPLVAKAAFHEHGAGYVLSKRAELWRADRHEYVWFYSVPHLTEAFVRESLRQVVAEGEPLVDPKPDHMSTTLAAIFLCDDADEEALNAVKTCRIRKSFQFSLWGWMEVQTAAAEMGRAAVTGNTCARDTAKFLKNLLHPKLERKKTHFFKIK
ncbi:MAG: hypothetical protein K6G17_06580 [Oscillospiraceae bacterium]|nr:hypothetical protein [Oscillospiraceae bacterium]